MIPDTREALRLQMIASSNDILHSFSGIHLDSVEKVILEQQHVIMSLLRLTEAAGLSRGKARSAPLLLRLSAALGCG